MSSTLYELYEKHELSKFMKERRTFTKDASIVSFTGMSGGKWIIDEKDSKLFYDLL